MKIWLISLIIFFFLDSKANNLENKMKVLNDFCDIINNLKSDNIKHKLFHVFITHNKILKIIFLDGIYDEIIKCSFSLLEYFAKNS